MTDPSPSFCHLHVHGPDSRLDGMVSHEAYAELCLATGMPGGALTDHGNLCGAISFYTEFKKRGLNPIIGEEIYLVENHEDKSSKRHHEILLATNWSGYQNLVALSTLGFTHGLQRNSFGCVDDAQLEEHNLGLICLSGCIGSRLARIILGGLGEQGRILARARHLEQIALEPRTYSDAKRAARDLALEAARATGLRRSSLVTAATSAAGELALAEELLRTGALGSYLRDLEKEAESLWDRSWRSAQSLCAARLRVFGDRYYLETQICSSREQVEYNGRVRELSGLTGIPVCLTGDAHYLRQEDADLHRTMLKVRTETRKPSKEAPKQSKSPSLPQEQEELVLGSSGEATELQSLFDELVRKSNAKVNLETKAHQERKRKWVQSAQIYYLQEKGSQGIEEEQAVSLDAIDPERPFSEWEAQFWVRTPQEMLEAGAPPQEMQRTLEIAARCKLEIPVNDDTHRIIHMPHFSLEEEDVTLPSSLPVPQLVRLCDEAHGLDCLDP